MSRNYDVPIWGADLGTMLPKRISYSLNYIALMDFDSTLNNKLSFTRPVYIFTATTF